jgi:hypothetical protein
MENAEVDRGMVAADLSGKLLAATETELKPSDVSPLRGKDYFRMTNEPPGSAGGSDSDDHVYIPPAKGDAEGDAVGVDKGAEHMNDEDEIGLREADVVVLPPKSLSEEEKEACEETVRVLNARPRLRTIPVELKKKWTQKQLRVWEKAKNAMKR